MLAVILASCPVFINPKPAAAISVDDYFTYDLDVEFSEDVIDGGEIFYATVDGTATCKQDLPLTVSKGYITSRIVAQHRSSGAKVTLNSRYTINIEPFPSEKGETVGELVVVPLRFPRGARSGTYDIVGELTEAKVTVTSFSITVTSYLPSSEAMGSVTHVADEDEDIVTGSSFDLYGYTDEHGIFTGDFIFQSDDGMCQLDIDKGTVGLTEDGEPLSEITITEMEEPPVPPTDCTIVGLAYHLGPDGATFDPPITLTLAYDEPLIADGATEDDLAIAM
jgi:hypothetical protein